MSSLTPPHTARVGSYYRDEITLSFRAEVLENPSLLQVHCEDRDRAVLVRDGVEKAVGRCNVCHGGKGDDLRGRKNCENQYYVPRIQRPFRMNCVMHIPWRTPSPGSEGVLRPLNGADRFKTGKSAAYS